MRRFSLLLAMLLACSFMISGASAFAQENGKTGSRRTDVEIKKMDFQRKDPVKQLENMKKDAQERYKKGELTKDQLDALTARIDKRLKAVKEFKKLPLEKKKDVLIDNFTRAIDKKVQTEWITDEDKAVLVDKFTERVSQWDGDGFPTFYHQGVMLVKKKMTGDHEKHHMHMYHKFVAALDKAVKEGTISEKQKEEILIYLRSMMKDMK